MISERTLRVMRRDALKVSKDLDGVDSEAECTTERKRLASAVITLTQELLDQHLLRK